MDGFDEATNFLSGEKYPTLSLVLPVLDGLKSHLNLDEDDESACKTIIKGVFLKSVKYYINRFNLDEKNDQLLAATFLDPRFKRFKRFNENSKLIIAAKRVIKEFVKNNKITSDIERSNNDDAATPTPQVAKKSLNVKYFLILYLNTLILRILFKKSFKF